LSLITHRDHRDNLKGVVMALASHRGLEPTWRAAIFVATPIDSGEIARLEPVCLRWRR
jgi:hypothetical protein